MSPLGFLFLTVCCIGCGIFSRALIDGCFITVLTPIAKILEKNQYTPSACKHKIIKLIRIEGSIEIMIMSTSLQNITKILSKKTAVFDFISIADNQVLREKVCNNFAHS